MGIDTMPRLVRLTKNTKANLPIPKGESILPRFTKKRRKKPKMKLKRKSKRKIRRVKTIKIIISS